VLVLGEALHTDCKAEDCKAVGNTAEAEAAGSTAEGCKAECCKVEAEDMGWDYRMDYCKPTFLTIVVSHRYSFVHYYNPFELPVQHH
jgi:hypothetical protein